MKNIFYKKVYRENYPLKTEQDLKIFYSKNRKYIIKQIEKVFRTNEANHKILMYKLKNNLVREPFSIRNRYIRDERKQRKLEYLLEKNMTHHTSLKELIYKLEMNECISLDITNKFLHGDRFIWR